MSTVTAALVVLAPTLLALLIALFVFVRSQAKRHGGSFPAPPILLGISLFIAVIVLLVVLAR